MNFPLFETAVQRLMRNGHQDHSHGRSDEALKRAKALIGDHAGIIADLEFQRMRRNEPSVFWAHASPPQFYQGSRSQVHHHGFGISTNPERAAVKAIGECIERYCAVPPPKNEFLFGSYETVNRISSCLAPKQFTFFSDAQYADPDIPFKKPNEQSQLSWVKGMSLVSGRPIFVPAFLVFTPFESFARQEPQEVPYCYPISTGLACGLTYGAAIYSGLLEVIERDAFMLSWRFEYASKTINTSRVNRPYTKSLLRVVESMPVIASIKQVNLEGSIAVAVAMFTNTNGEFPMFAMGAGSNVDWELAVASALEEAILCYCGLGRLEDPLSIDPERVSKSGFNPLVLNALAHSVDNELKMQRAKLTEPSPFSELHDSHPSKRSIKSLVNELSTNGFDAIVVDITPQDVEEAGFKVVRALVPGYQPLDVDSNWPYLGLERSNLLARNRGLSERDYQAYVLERLPHPFP